MSELTPTSTCEDDEKCLELFEDMRLSATNVTRVNNVDVIVNEDSEMLGFCHIPVFSYLAKSDDVKGLLAVYLAMKHLNYGIGTVIPELDGINSRCNIRFTTEFIDTEGSERIAIDELITINRRKPEVEQLPCAFLGSDRSAVSVPMAIINGIEGYPQISHFSTSAQLDDKSQYGLFGRVIPSDNGTAEVVILFLKEKLKVSHFGVIHTDDSYGMGYVSSLQTAINIHAPEMRMHSVKISYHNPALDEIKSAIEQLKSTQFSYFFAVINPEKYPEIMTEAYDQDIAGPGYNWLFSDSVSPGFFLDDDRFKNNKALVTASNGISILSAAGGLSNVGMTVYDIFFNAWSSLNNEEDINILQSKFPDHVDVDMRDLFDGPSTDASLLYDATVALGMGACEAKKNESFFKGGDHYLNVLQNSFIGSTGNVTFDKDTGSRDPMSALFKITNIQQRKSNKIGTFKAVPSELFQSGEWKSLSPYVFSDNSTMPPPELPEVTMNYNYLSPTLKIIGYVLCCILLFFSTSFALWTVKNRNGKIVKASQPLFLIIICMGTIMMGVSIIPLTIDDKTSSTKMCRIACMTVPWLFSTGFCIAFSALFTKVWKLNKLFFNAAMVRVQIQTKDIIKPMIVITSVNSIALIAWNIVSPSQWVRTISQVDIHGRTISSSGKCSSQYELQFMAAVIAINAITTASTLYQAHRARHIKTLLGETKYIESTSACMFLVILMGIPIKILVKDNVNVSFFVNLFINFVTGMSFVYFIFLPKYKNQRKLDSGEINMKDIVSDFTKQAHAYQSRASSKNDAPTLKNVSEIMTTAVRTTRQNWQERKSEISSQDNPVEDGLTGGKGSASRESTNEFTLVCSKHNVMENESKITSRNKAAETSLANGRESISSINEFTLVSSKRNLFEKESETKSQDEPVLNGLTKGRDSA